jgi:biopolymer transport protein ExbB
MPNSLSPASFGLSHFLAHGSMIELVPLYLLVLMSVATWSVIVLKAAGLFRLRRRAARFLRQGWAGGGIEQIERFLAQRGAHDPWSRLTARSLAACRQLNRRPTDAPVSLGEPNQYLTRVLRRAIDSEALETETGLTILAIIASSAPFVGLFGTVWGIYNALIAIGTAGQSSLEQVAGPVGEALIMTAFGLATALPAVLAYNVFVRANRRILSDLDGFAHDLFAFLAGVAHSGAEVTPHPASARLQNATESRSA